MATPDTVLDLDFVSCIALLIDAWIVDESEADGALFRRKIGFYLFHGQTCFPPYSIQPYQSAFTFGRVLSAFILWSAGLWWIMGRTALTYRQRLEAELERWRSFRKALLKDEREAFDSLVGHVYHYAHAASMYPERDPFDLLIMSGLLSHEERLRLLEKELKLEMRLDARLAP